MGSLAKMSRDIHGTFHELFPPIPEPIKAIKAFEDKKAPIAKYATWTRSEVRRPPRSRRAGCFVGVRAVARVETKHKANRSGVKSLWEPWRGASCAPWRTQDERGPPKAILAARPKAQG